MSLDSIEAARGEEIRLNGGREELLHQVNALSLPHLVVKVLETGFQRLRIGRTYQVAILWVALGAVFVYSVNILKLFLGVIHHWNCSDLNDF